MTTGNGIIDDCKWFADKHRGKNIQSGPHWSTIIRFPELYDEAVRLKEYTEQLQAEIERLRSQVRTALKASQIDIDTNLLMNIEQLQAQLTHKVTIIAELQSEITRLTNELERIESTVNIRELNDNIERLKLIEENDKWKRLVDMKNDALDSYAEFYNCCLSVCGMDIDTNPCTEADERILETLRKGVKNE